MKFEFINNKKILYIIISSFIITSLSGCKNNIEVNIYNENIETTEETTKNVTDNTINDIIQDTTLETKEDITNNYTEDDLKVIETFKKIETELNEIIENDKEFIDDTKSTFTSLVNFIFFEGEINGVKFNDLTDSGKQKVLELFTNIDLKIDNKFPNYKETIKEKTKEALDTVGEFSSDLYDKGKQKIKEWYNKYKK